MERRHNTDDLLTKVLRVLASSGWLSLILLQVLFWMAAPELDSGIARYHELEIRTTWEQQWVNWLPFLLATCAILSLLALGIRPFRSRRKSDPKRIHLLILLTLTGGGYIIYWIEVLDNISN